MGTWWNRGLHLITIIGGAAAAVVASSPLGILPAAVIGFAVKVVGGASLAAIIAAKVAPGLAGNSPGVAISPAAAATQVKP